MSEIRVALVEDHDLTRVGLKTTLQRGGVKVIGEAANGVEGLKLLQSSRPDVAVIDIGLPNMDGIELTRRFKQFLSEGEPSGLPPTRVMMLTMQNDEDAVLAAFAAGADSYCMKDLNAESLIQALHVTHEGNHWIDPAIARIVLQQSQQSQEAHAGAEMAAGKTVTINADSDYSEMLETYPLTERELEVLELIVAGSSNADIADKLYITVGTVKTHVRNILNKLCADDRTQAAVRALRAGLVS
ncbi:MAG: response regulator transcription factor [Leptolyngbyaceae cyanobacterium bins.59]|nr:response regulator transcription factor [Leptolyngbyaceae cyanobacterium bins.59]